SYRYEPVTQVALAPGSTYVLGALYQPQSADSVIFFSTQTYAPMLTYVGSRSTTLSPAPTFAFPNADPSADEGIFGPNFQFLASSATPEPGSLPLFVLGALALLAG